MSTPDRSAAFRPGQLVRISESQHPWYLAYGTITGPFSSTLAPALKWEVELEGGTYGAYPGQRVAVAENEIRSVE